jgi:hypothetical protein
MLLPQALRALQTKTCDAAPEIAAGMIARKKARVRRRLLRRTSAMPAGRATTNMSSCRDAGISANNNVLLD